MSCPYGLPPPHTTQASHHHLVNGVHNVQHLIPGDVAVVVQVVEFEGPCNQPARMESPLAWGRGAVPPCISACSPAKSPITHPVNEYLLLSIRSDVSDSATPRTVAYQSPPPMQFPRQEYWSGLPFPTAGVLPHPGINLTSRALAGRCFTAEPPGKPNEYLHQHKWEETERHTHKRDTGTISTRVIEDIYMQRRHQVCKNQGPRRISQATALPSHPPASACSQSLPLHTDAVSG